MPSGEKSAKKGRGEGGIYFFIFLSLFSLSIPQLTWGGVTLWEQA